MEDWLMCRTVRIDELIRGLAVTDSQKVDDLRATFKNVDLTRRGGLEFREVAGKAFWNAFTNLNFELVRSD
jgi:hypothetical protein